MEIFSDRVRTDRTEAFQSEGRFSFLDRSALPVFAAVRDLLEDWLSHVPAEHRPPLVGAFRADKDETSFGSAFWELYLHETYLRCGHKVTIHPPLPGTPKRPDFLVDGDGGRFYVEAVQVGTSPADLAENRRLAQAHDVLNTVPTDRFSLSLSYERIGPRPLATKRLRQELTAWLSLIDPDDVAAALEKPDWSGEPAFYRMPRYDWNDDGWRLQFHAVPLRPGLAPNSTPMIGMYGPATAQVIDKHTGLMRALDSKANRYGKPDLPLVIAVLDNTGPPVAHDYNIEQALYGLSAARPPQSAANLDVMHTEGHWLTKTGWRRGHAPQTISAINLSPWNVRTHHPLLWETLEPGTAAPLQPGFLARVDLTQPDPHPLPADPNPFGLPDDWPGPDPEFD